ncbi:MAG TPA: MFS transporter [Gemmatimonadaceae bacterium]|nr:MFS transporter [Gemmatimonadaceae bacterium]
MAALAEPIEIPAVDDGDAIVAEALARERFSWAMYDFSNTIFSMNIGTLFLTAWLVHDMGVSNTRFAMAKSLVSALVIVSIPIFGAVSDTTRRHKPFVVWFTVASCIATISMGVVGQLMAPAIGDSVRGTPAVSFFHLTGTPLLLILGAYVIADYTYQGAQPFYNAMLPDLTPSAKRGSLSGFGTALGYVGSIAGVLIAFPFFNWTLPIVGALPGGVMNTLTSIIPFTHNGGRVSTFVPTGLMFFAFSFPLILFCRDHRLIRGKRVDWRKGFSEVFETVKATRKYPGLGRFILTTFLYQDAMGTIIGYMALYAIYAMGFKGGQDVMIFVALTIPAVLGSYPLGKLVDRIGPKKTLMIVLSSWVLLLIAMVLVPGKTGFWIVGALIGFIFGGTATAERPLMLTLVPDKEAARFFSLLVLSSRAAAILGPVIWSLAVDGLTPRVGAPLAYRAAVVTVAIAMLGSLLMLSGVPDKRRFEPAG